MGPMGRDFALARLGETLTGSFAASARGILGSDFAIQGREGEEIGRLRIFGPEGADLEAGDLEARIERSAPARYTMLAGGATILSARPAGALNRPEIWCLDRLYQGRLSLLRNAAEAGPAGDEVTIRITGGLTNRNYEATFDAGDEGSLPVAFFLLYLAVALRRKAYLTAGLGRVDPT
jgi:signal transduction histidine kinase